MRKIYPFLLVFFIAASVVAQRPKPANFIEKPTLVNPSGFSRGVADTIFWDGTNGSIPALYYMPDPDTPTKPAGFLVGTDQVLSAFGDEGNFTEEVGQIFMNTQKVKVQGSKFCFGYKNWVSGDTTSVVVFKLFRLDGQFVNKDAAIVPGPGTLLATDTVKLRDLKILIAGQETLFTGSQNVFFKTPVDVDSGGYMMGMDIRGLNPIDTLGMFSSYVNLNHPKEKSMLKAQFSTWKSFMDPLYGYNADIDLAIFPIVEFTRYTNLKDSLCFGETIQFGDSTLSVAGTYIDTFLTDEGRDSVVTIQLTIFADIDTAVQLSGNELIANNANAGATYLWFDCATQNQVPGATTRSFSPTVTGNYQVQVTENGCVKRSACVSISLDCKAYFTATVDGNDAQKYNVEEQSIGAGLQYQWTFGDDSSSTERYPVHVYAQAGVYTVCLIISGDSACADTFCTDAFYSGGGLIKTLNVVAPDTSIGIGEVIAFRFSLQPNPAKDNCTIYPADKSSNTWSAAIYTIQGQLVNNLFSQQTTQPYTFSTHAYPAGIYIVRTITANGKTGVSKLVIQ